MVHTALVNTIPAAQTPLPGAERGGASPLQVRYMDAHSRRAGMMDYALRVKELNLQALRLADERISHRWLGVLAQCVSGSWELRFR